MDIERVCLLKRLYWFIPGANNKGMTLVKKMLLRIDQAQSALSILEEDKRWRFQDMVMNLCTITYFCSSLPETW